MAWMRAKRSVFLIPPMRLCGRARTLTILARTEEAGVADQWLPASPA